MIAVIKKGDLRENRNVKSGKEPFHNVYISVVVIIIFYIFLFTVKWGT